MPLPCCLFLLLTAQQRKASHTNLSDRRTGFAEEQRNQNYSYSSTTTSTYHLHSNHPPTSSHPTIRHPTWPRSHAGRASTLTLNPHLLALMHQSCQHMCVHASVLTMSVPAGHVPAAGD